MYNLGSKAAVMLANLIVYVRHPVLILTFYGFMGYWPNVCYPQTKNEKFLWRKIFDRNPLYRLLTDKLTVRQFIKTKCPDLSMSDIVWIGANPEQIPDTLLQPGFVIKTNNGSDRNIFTGGTPLDRAQINQLVTTWLTRPYEVSRGQWVYDKIQPYVFIERLITLPGDSEFVDISCHVVMGKCMLVTVEKDLKRANERIAIYDPQGNRVPTYYKADKSRDLPEGFPVPPTFDRAMKCAEHIARDFDYIRVDFMSVVNRLYFCECTIFPMAGFSIMSGEADSRIAAQWDLRNSWFMQRPQRGLSRIYCKLYNYCLDA